MKDFYNKKRRRNSDYTKRKQRGGEVNCDYPLNKGECLECLEEWYFSFGEKLRKNFKKSLINATKDLLQDINDEPDIEVRAELIEDAAIIIKDIKSTFNLKISKLRSEEFDQEYKRKVKHCDEIESFPPIRRGKFKRR